MNGEVSRWLRLAGDLVALGAICLAAYMWLDARFDRLEYLTRDRWTGADMRNWVAGAERAHEEAENPREVKLPNPYDIRRQRMEGEHK